VAVEFYLQGYIMLYSLVKISQHFRGKSQHEAGSKQSKLDYMAISQKIELLIATAMRTSDPT
jgi:hypothetical protein